MAGREDELRGRRPEDARSKAAAGGKERAAARRPQDGGRDLGRDDGAEDIDVVRGAQPLDGGVEDWARIGEGGVVHDDAGRPGSAEDAFERLAVAVQIGDVRDDRLDLEAAAAQVVGELVEGSTAGDEGAAKALAAEAPDDAGADSWAGSDQQQMAGVNGLGHLAPPVGPSPRRQPGATVLGGGSPAGCSPRSG